MLIVDAVLTRIRHEKLTLTYCYRIKPDTFFPKAILTYYNTIITLKYGSTHFVSY